MCVNEKAPDLELKIPPGLTKEDVASALLYRNHSLVSDIRPGDTALTDVPVAPLAFWEIAKEVEDYATELRLKTANLIEQIEVEPSRVHLIEHSVREIIEALFNSLNSKLTQTSHNLRYPD